MRTVSVLVALISGAILSQASSATTSFKTVDFQPILMDVTVAEWEFFDHENALYLSCPHEELVEDAGPVIYDPSGHPVWMNNSDPFVGLQCHDVNVQTYNGVQYLTMWVGEGTASGYGTGSGLMFDNSFNLIHTVSAGNGLNADLHEFNIPTQTNSSALFTIYNPVQMNLTTVGLSEDSWVLDSLFQEVDIASGDVIFQWSALDHLDVTNSFATPSAANGTGTGTEDSPWDAVHINAVDKDDDGNYLISCRHYHQVFKIDGTSGDILWRMGGKDNDFTMNNGTNFEWQHHARWHNDFQEMTLFDNAATNWEVDEASARGLQLLVNQTNLTVSLIQDFYPAWRNYSNSQGDVQLLDDGNYLLGYGSNPWMTEHLPNGTIVWAASIGPLGSDNSNGNIQNYRAFKVTNWAGRPINPPDVAVENGSVYVSWNGATDVQSWVLYGGSDDDDFDSLTVMATMSKNGFENSFSLNTTSAPSFISVLALGSSGNEIGRSGVFQVSDGSQLSSGTSSYADETTDSTSNSFSPLYHVGFSPFDFIVAYISFAILADMLL